MLRADLRREARESATSSVAESEARLRALVAALPQGVVMQDTDGAVVSANPAARRLLGLDAEEPLAGPPKGSPDVAPGDSVPSPRPAPGRLLIPPHPRTSPETTGAGRAPRARFALSGPHSPAMIALRTGLVQRAASVTVRGTTDGEMSLVVTSVPLLADDGHPHAVVSSINEALSDTTPSGLAAVPRQSEEMFRLAMAHSPIGFALMGLSGRFLRVNRKLCRMLGYRSDELEARTLFELVHPDDLEDTSVQIGDMMRGRQAAVEMERRYLGHGGMVLWGELSIALVHDPQGRPLHFVVQVQDVSEVRKAHELLTHMTLHDTLTTLPNRTLVLDRIQKSLDRLRDGHRVAVLVCDLDHFSVLNDSIGHEQGDTVLVEISRRLTRALRPVDTAGRLGADEFVVVCEDVADEHEAIALAERIRRSVAVPLAAGDRTVVPSMSIGIAVSSTSGSDAAVLLRDADTAANRAKDHGRNRWAVADTAMRRRAVERLDVEHALRTGVEAGELRLHFQPIVDVRTSEVVGREALVRWQHPERGLLAPGDFLHIAEQTDLITEVGRWVTREATRAAAASGETSGYVAINVSPHQVSRPGLAAMVEQTLQDTGLPPGRLVVELTESAVLSAAPSARSELARLDDIGVRIVVDDFGTGFSPLSYLRDLPVSGIKVDRSFTAGLGVDPQCDRIVEALTGLGRGLGVDVVVEGVETESQRIALDSMGCEHAQGFLFGRPTPGFDAAGRSAQLR